MPSHAKPDALLAPNDGHGVIVLTNTATPFGAYLLAEEIMRSELTVTDPVAVSTAPPPDQSQAWQDIIGYYRPQRGLLTNVRIWQLIGLEAQVVVKDKRLLLRCFSPLGELRRGVPLRSNDIGNPLSFEVNVGGMVVPVVFPTRRLPEGDRHVHRPSPAVDAAPKGAMAKHQDSTDRHGSRRNGSGGVPGAKAPAVTVDASMCKASAETGFPVPSPQSNRRMVSGVCTR